jgi:glycosyltransferase involved in cell wall biosynthesis
METKRSPRKINIAFIIWTLEGMGGSERVVYDLARKLDRSCYEVTVVGFRDGPVRKLYEEMGVKVVVAAKERRLDLSLVRSLKKVFSEGRIDVVNPHHFQPFLYSSSAATGERVKVVYTEHSRWQLEQLSPLEKIVNRVLLARTEAVVAISRQIEEYYLRTLLLRKKKVHLIGNGIDIGRFGKRNSRRLRQNLHIAEHEKVVGMVANLRPEKNHAVLITAFSEVAGSLKDAKLLLVGLDCMGGEVQRLAAQSNASDKILFLGQRDDIPELLGAFDIFCLPSIYEGLPLTILEAMAAGVPVIGADVLGINEVVVPEVNGLLFPGNDAKKLSQLILRALTDRSLRDRLSSAGRQYVDEHYNLDRQIEKYETLFRTVCNGSPV